jgi:hypothetical protein
MKCSQYYQTTSPIDLALLTKQASSTFAASILAIRL